MQPPSWIWILVAIVLVLLAFQLVSHPIRIG